jgi:hypothetical protein
MEERRKLMHVSRRLFTELRAFVEQRMTQDRQIVVGRVPPSCGIGEDVPPHAAMSGGG